MRQNMQNEKISELYTDDKKSKYSRNPIDILKSKLSLEASYNKDKG